MSGAVLDTGALIAFEREDRRVVAMLHRALSRGETLVVPACVVAQVWRDGRRQVRLADLLDGCEIASLDDLEARATGQLLGVTRTDDVVDASVAVAARRRAMRVITSDPDDIRALDRTLDVIAL